MNPTEQKKADMLKIIIDAADYITKQVKSMPFKSGKRIFPIRDKSKGKKKRRAIAMAKIYLSKAMAVAQIKMILNQRYDTNKRP